MLKHAGVAWRSSVGTMIRSVSSLIYSMSATSPATKSVVGGPYSPMSNCASRDHAMTPACFVARCLRCPDCPLFTLLISRAERCLQLTLFVAIERNDDD